LERGEDMFEDGVMTMLCKNKRVMKVGMMKKGVCTRVMVRR
jgi:hypothetical protein